ncbi:hypothetical protein PC110_g3833 [Phytophthora cactorum]|uniref:RNase H type-1 domain-containing protein n=1 Tax=Phytophthora cactorum TaxID=29920 RepID=A0A329STI0_9STRA|nr:hypothetical protein PC117_g2889 [Phytophthora cactorum]RAW39939.1 hypothetical protein PC110_g3833 [Phytophthora cactorum]
MQYFLSELTRRAGLSLPDLVRLARGETAEDSRPNKALDPSTYERLLVGFPQQELLVRIDREGFRARWLQASPPQSRWPRNHWSAMTSDHLVVGRIREGEEIGAYIVIDVDVFSRGVHVSPFGAIAKKESQADAIRLIHDLSTPTGCCPNDLTETSSLLPVKCEHVSALAARIELLQMRFPNLRILMLKGDVHGAFRHLRHHAADVRWMGGPLPDRSAGVIDLSAPFGWAGSPALYAVFGRAIPPPIHESKLDMSGGDYTTTNIPTELKSKISSRRVYPNYWTIAGGWEPCNTCMRLGGGVWRVAHFDTSNDVSSAHHEAQLQVRLKHSYERARLHIHATIHGVHMSRAASIVRSLLTRPWVPTLIEVSPSSPWRYLLLFDGGSRGNPGPGGSGAVVVDLGQTATQVKVCWFAGMSYTDKATTNNDAENMGLLSGLRACVKYNWSPLNIVGDSQLIIRQRTRRKAPLARYLPTIFWKCRRLTGKLKLLTWQHHRREFNKAADALANVAMDQTKSCQFDPSSRLTLESRWKEALEHASTDIAHWTARNSMEDPSGSENGTV